MADPTNTPTDILSTLVSNSHSIQDAMANLGGFLKDAAIKYGPDIADTFMWVLRLNAASSIFLGLMGLVGLIVFWKIGMKRWWNCEWAKDKRESDDSDYRAGFWFPTVVVTIGINGFFVVLATRLLQIWDWVMLFNPILGLAGKLFTKFLDF